MTRNIGYIAYQLRELMKQREIASVFTDPNNPDDFIAGYVRAVNAKSALIQSIGPYGRYDGWFAVRLGCVLEVSYDAPYAERLKRMLLINAETARELPDDELDWEEGDHAGLFLRHALREARVVTAWTREEAYTGFVSEVDDLYATLELLDFMGQRADRIRLKLLDIELTSIGSEEERMYEQLNRHPE